MGGRPLRLTALDLIDKLISCWLCWPSQGEYYLKDLAPSIVNGSAVLPANEQKICDLLRELLSPEEWGSLPDLIAARRARRLEDIESDRIRREQERLERERHEEDERRKREQERLEKELRKAELQRARQAFIDQAQSVFDSAFLNADTSLADEPGRSLFTNEQYLELKIKYVQDWAKRVLQQTLDPQQAAAVAATGGDIRVVARAGAGKTRTLVTRALFLKMHCDIPAENLLLLAFNRAAATEMQERLKKTLGDAVPHVMTFHALAYALVHPDEDLVYDEPSAGNLALSREVQDVIDEHLQSDVFGALIRDLMLQYFREDWERIIEGGFHLPIKELVEYRLALPRETLNGDYVKSFGERLIANTLFQNDIDYKYERNYRWNGVNYRPDFTILLPERRGVVIEYFGLKGDPYYDQMSQEKREFWKSQAGWTLLEYSPNDITSRSADGFATLLLQQLDALGVKGRRLSEEEIWERIHKRAVDTFTRAMKTFVGRCRNLNIDTDQLNDRIERHTPISDAESMFLRVGASVYSGYLSRLKSGNKEDFDGLMWRAVARLEKGESRFARDKGRERGDLRKIRFVLIDEFQDFSRMFYELSKGIRSLSPEAEFFCVGDDWQAINGFAGSDLRFFEDFESFFRTTSTLGVTTNYRSPKRVVEIGNALMLGRGDPAEAKKDEDGRVSAAFMSDFRPSATEQARHKGDEATPALLRLVRRVLDSGHEVVMLSRRNDVPGFVNYPREAEDGIDGLERFAEHIRSYLPENDRPRVTASTAHKYKGLEKDAVIVLDANQGCYPLIHPNWVFLRLFGDTLERIESEERRLFYVALTRSKQTLVIVSDDPERESPYLKEIKFRMRLDSIRWDELPPVASIDGARIEVRVFNAYDVRDQLKKLGYRWNEPLKSWCRSMLAEGFSFEALCGQEWARNGAVIKIYSEEGRLIQDNERALR